MGLLAGLAIGFFPAVQAAENLAAQYAIDIWKTQQGLPQNTVNSIMQTRDGYLWVGTRFGLSRFDGVRFQVFSRNSTPALPNNNIFSLAEDNEGNVWAGTLRGLVQMKDRTSRFFARTNGLPADRVGSLCASAQGGVWIGTDGGVARYHAGRITTYTQTAGLRAPLIRVVYEDAKGRVYAGHDAGVQQLDFVSGKFTDVVDTEEMLAVTAILRDRQGTLWLGTTDGVRQVGDGQLVAVPALSALRGSTIRCLVEDRDGSLWAGSSELGAARLTEGRLGVLGPDGGISEKSVQALYQDREGSMWVGTEFGGLNRCQRSRVKTYTASNGLLSDRVHSIHEAPSGRVWVGTDAGFSRLFESTTRAGSRERVRTIDYPDRAVRSVMEDSQGRLWIGGRDLFECMTEGVVSNLYYFGGYTNRQVHAIMEDRQHNIWYGSETRLHCLKDGRLTVFVPPGNTPNFTIRAILEDRTGGIWIGSRDRGLMRLKDGKFTRLPQPPGQPVAQGWSLREDADGVIWAGTEFGLNRYQDGRVFGFTEREGLFDNMVIEIQEDAAANFWISCNRGIYRVNRKDLNEVAAGRKATVPYVVYDESDGMLSGEALGECQPASWKSRDGRLWFPTIKGVVVIDPPRMADNPVRPPVIVEQVIADDHIIFGDEAGEELAHAKAPFAESLSLPPGRAQVMEFHYTANSLAAPEKVRFQYQLEGYDKEWRDAGSRRVAFYTNLRPGNYRFRVKACNNHGIWNESGALFAFVLQPHFYQTYSFYGGCLVAAVGMAMGAHRLRIRQLRDRQRELVTQVDQRTVDLRKEINERKQAEAQLVEHKRHLEEEVNRRTVELTVANERLKQDLVERQRAEKERLNMERKLQESQKLESLGVLAGGVAHDFNNLLTGILGNTGLIRRDIPPESVLQNKLEQIETASLRAADLAKQMLAYAGKGRLHVTSLDLGTVVRETVQLLQFSLGKKIELKLNLSPGLPPVLADATQVNQVIMNLVINASEAIGNQPGTISIATLLVKADRAFLSGMQMAQDLGEGEYVCLRISDTGCGMTAETMARIFDPFFTTKFAGRGLGLAAVLGIVRGHKGALRVESELGRGSQFTLLLPRATEGQKPVVVPSELPTWRGKGTVLVVDDEEVVRTVASSMMNSIGFDTVVASDGREAIDLFAENPNKFCLVLLDLMMPFCDGEEAFHSVRRLRSDVPVIIMSGVDEMDAMARFAGAGIEGYLHKPFKLDALREKARAALSKT
jgi:ligand-binding sensor domain-containing protein/signal transduction histidine kinase/CheY-like chemotaxis protein